MVPSELSTSPGSGLPRARSIPDGFGQQQHIGARNLIALFWQYQILLWYGVLLSMDFRRLNAFRIF
jgi:hypothetical protein